MFVFGLRCGGIYCGGSWEHAALPLYSLLLATEAFLSLQGCVDARWIQLRRGAGQGLVEVSDILMEACLGPVTETWRRRGVGVSSPTPTPTLRFLTRLLPPLTQKSRIVSHTHVTWTDDLCSIAKNKVEAQEMTDEVGQAFVNNSWPWPRRRCRYGIQVDGWSIQSQGEVCVLGLHVRANCGKEGLGSLHRVLAARSLVCSLRRGRWKPDVAPVLAIGAWSWQSSSDVWRIINAGVVLMLRMMARIVSRREAPWLEWLVRVLPCAASMTAALRRVQRGSPFGTTSRTAAAFGPP